MSYEITECTDMNDFKNLLINLFWLLLESTTTVYRFNLSLGTYSPPPHEIVWSTVEQLFHLGCFFPSHNVLACNLSILFIVLWAQSYTIFYMSAFRHLKIASTSNMFNKNKEISCIQTNTLHVTKTSSGLPNHSIPKPGRRHKFSKSWNWETLVYMTWDDCTKLFDANQKSWNLNYFSLHILKKIQTWKFCLMGQCVCA